MPKQAPAMKKRAVRGSRTGRPIMALLDLLGRRWTLRILWELRGGSLTSELREAGLIELLPGDGYGLTRLGQELNETFLPLLRFAERWSKHVVG
jgi:DNA-binding HxlR family transcriptional regulator